MKKAFFSLLLILSFFSFGFSQGIPQVNRTFGFQSATTSGAKAFTGIGYGFYKIKWEVQGGTLSACTVSLQGSNDGVTFGTTFIANTTCTSDGESIITAVGANSSYIRVNVSAYTVSFGIPTLNVTVSAWNEVTGATATNPLNTAVVASSASTSAVSMVFSTAYEASHIVKATAGNLYGLFGYNSKTSSQFIQCYNSATLPADTAVPIITFTVPASSNYSLSSGSLPINFSTGIVCGNSSTGPTKTIGSADTWFNILYN